MEPELFDVILGTLTERGHIQAWKSELMYHAVKPLYETGVIPRKKVDIGDNRNVLKLRLLMDLLAQLGLDNTRKMLLSEVDVGDEDIQADIPDLAEKRKNTEEPLLNVLLRITGHGDQEDTTAQDQEHLPDLNSSSKDLANEDLFETAVEELLGDMTIAPGDDPVP